MGTTAALVPASHHGALAMSLPVVSLVFIGIVVAFLGLFAAGNIYMTALGIGAIAFAGLLEVLGARRA